MIERPMIERYGECEVCKREPAVGVCSSSIAPISLRYGRMCLDLGAEPLWFLSAVTLADTEEQFRADLKSGAYHDGALDALYFVDGRYITAREWGSIE